MPLHRRQPARLLIVARRGPQSTHSVLSSTPPRNKHNKLVFLFSLSLSSTKAGGCGRRIKRMFIAVNHLELGASAGGWGEGARGWHEGAQSSGAESSGTSLQRGAPSGDWKFHNWKDLFLVFQLWFLQTCNASKPHHSVGARKSIETERGRTGHP